MSVTTPKELLDSRCQLELEFSLKQLRKAGLLPNISELDHDMSALSAGGGSSPNKIFFRGTGSIGNRTSEDSIGSQIVEAIVAAATKLGILVERDTSGGQNLKVSESAKGHETKTETLLQALAAFADENQKPEVALIIREAKSRVEHDRVDLENLSKMQSGISVSIPPTKKNQIG